MGTRHVDFKADRDEIAVTGVSGTFSRLMFRVENNDLEIHKVVVVFGKGTRHEIPVKLIFREGERSRFVDLPGDNRVIRKVIFFYRTIGPKIEGKAEVKGFGIR